jgi:hypothetical protein
MNRLIRLFTWLSAAALASFTLAGCGGGSSGTGAPLVGKSFVAGPLTIDGQVAGAPVQTAQVLIKANGVTINDPAQLQAGMQLQANLNNAATQSITYEADAIGVITRLQPLGTQTIVTLMGREAVIDGATRGPDGVAPGLALGQTLEVSGTKRSDGRLQVSFARLVISTTIHQTLDTISAHGPAGQVQVGGLNVDVTGLGNSAMVASMPLGTRVVVRGVMTSASTMQASHFAIHAWIPPLDAGSAFSIEGLVQQLAADQVVVNDQAIGVSAAISANAGAALQAGARVRISGIADASLGLQTSALQILSLSPLP